MDFVYSSILSSISEVGADYFSEVGRCQSRTTERRVG